MTDELGNYENNLEPNFDNNEQKEVIEKIKLLEKKFYDF